MVDARFKAIPLLQEIHINLYDEPINLDVREKMNGYGWAIKIPTSMEWESDKYVLIISI